MRVHTQVRFDFFCKAALEFLLRTGRQPDILHCHDWSTAHVAKVCGGRGNVGVDVSAWCMSSVAVCVSA
eukprot:scaffold17784_cov22-Tisochrysis_lutea.AAC.2